MSEGLYKFYVNTLPVIFVKILHWLTHFKFDSKAIINGGQGHDIVPIEKTTLQI